MTGFTIIKKHLTLFDSVIKEMTVVNAKYKQWWLVDNLLF